MNLFFFNVALAVVWAVLTFSFTVPNLVFGFVLGYLALWVARKAFADASYFGKLPGAIILVAFVLFELFRSSLLLVRDVLTKTDYSRPYVLAVPLRVQTDAEITLLANIISLTPGTVSVDVSEDRRVLYVHSLYTYDDQQVIRAIQDRLEARILNLTRRNGEAPERSEEEAQR